MQDLTTRLTSLSRPRLLMKTARAGRKTYKRSKELRRVLGGHKTPAHPAGMMRLLEMEHEMEHRRKLQKPAYDLMRHVELLIALLSEGEAYIATQLAKKGGSPAGKPPDCFVKKACAAPPV